MLISKSFILRHMTEDVRTQVARRVSVFSNCLHVAFAQGGNSNRCRGVRLMCISYRSVIIRIHITDLCSIACGIGLDVLCIHSVHTFVH